MTTGFFWDERCFWHGGGNYAGMLPVGGLVQPMVGGGLPESPESKRRLKNLMDVTGLSGELDLRSASEASRIDLLRVHPASYLDTFKAASDTGGGELGRRTPFGPGGYEMAALSAGLSIAALQAVLKGDVTNAYALSRPPGHHCLPDYPNGFCLFANLALAIQSARANDLTQRVVVLDWDVHHGNGTEAIFYEDPDVLTISMHQDRNYPMDTGDFTDRGRGKGAGFNLNIPLPPGTGHIGYLSTMEQIVIPQIQAFKPDVIVIACGYDAAAIDPLGRMLATAETFQIMTQQVKSLAQDLCNGRLMMAHEGGYSKVYVPFCGHHVIAEMAGSDIVAPDPFGEVFPLRQPSAAFDRFLDGLLGDMADAL
ncbi:histone deacetylase-like amidohydrolase HdaH [Octadecabacter antarcticus 307]|uniref:Histone deacetylase-like amidohydrolase HdaH n=1 Tax=Octadecabacter antarcticus 307 TaxID=391626 RepID=M9RAE4_9RHOB|nr:class II histone deacetylase [Octadecabacter antarcticus]AGI66725.1 histone deacetylase-like amidohydrolase HdaH [Octadecabacter antarcticus 307]